MTLFSVAEHKYPFLDKEDKIDTVTFLLASQQILKLVDLLGLPFRPVRLDIEGNIKAIQKRYDSCPQKFNNLRNIVVDDTGAGKEPSTSLNLLWLKRTLEFIHSFATLLVQSYRDKSGGENMTSLVKQAYHDTLKHYHSFLARAIFNVIVRMIPYRRDFLRLLSQDTNDEQLVIEEMDEFSKALETNIVILQDIYKDLHLD